MPAHPRSASNSALRYDSYSSSATPSWAREFSIELGAPSGRAVCGDQRRERSCPVTALGRQRRAIDLEEAAVDAAVPIRHRPVREALIEVARQESNEWWMDPRIGVEAVHGLKPIAMANQGCPRCRKEVDSPARLTASTQAFHRRCTALRSSPARSSSSLSAPDQDRALAGTSVRNRDKASVSSRIHESSWPIASGMPCNTTARHRSRRDPVPATSSSAPGTELLDQQRLDVAGEDAARRQLLAVPRFGQERFATQPFARLLDRLFEPQVFEGVQRVVMDEDADRALRRQQVREPIDDAGDGMIGQALVQHHGLLRILISL